MTSDQEERKREEKIRLRALEIWREQGCPNGRAREHWEQAEREVDAEDARSAEGKVSRKRSA
jgi:Protein of unknown function (DUF2934)